MVRNPLLGSLGDNFKMWVKEITGHKVCIPLDRQRRRPSSTVEPEKFVPYVPYGMVMAALSLVYIRFDP